MNSIYHSSTRGRMRASHKTKALMSALRAATFNHKTTDSVATSTELSEARADIVEYIGKLEADLMVHQAQRAEQQRRTTVRMGGLPPPRYIDFETYKPRFEDLTFRSQRPFEPRRYQKGALDIIERYSYRGSLRDWMAQSRVMVPPAWIGIDFARVEQRVAAWWDEQRREQAVVMAGIA